MPTKAEIQTENDELRKRLLAMEERLDSTPQAASEPEPELTERGCNPLALMFLLMCMMLVGSVLIALGVALYVTRSGDEVAPTPDRPRTALVDEIERAMSGPDAELHALYLSKVCRGVAGRLADDFKQQTPIIDQRQEAADLFGIVGQFATSAEGVNTYRELPTVIEGVMRDTLGEKLEGGAVTDADEAALVEAWNDLADAFAEVSE